MGPNIPRVIFLVLLLGGTFLVMRATLTLYSKSNAVPTEEDKQRELNMILEREVLGGKANIQRIDNDELLDFQFKQKPSVIYSDMFDRDPFRIGL